MGDDSTAQKTVSQRFQFGLRSLMLCIVATAVTCAGVAAWSRASLRRENIRRDVAGPLEDLGAQVTLEWSLEHPTVSRIAFYNGNVCHDDDLALLKEHRHLRSITLGWCPITDAGLADRKSTRL